MLYKYSIFVTICALASIASGALLTTKVATVPSHEAIAIATSALSLILIAWLAREGGRLRLLGLIALVLLAGEAALGIGTAPLPAGIAVFHACLAPVFFSILVAIVMRTSPGWKHKPEIVDNRGSLPLRPLAAITPAVVLAQIGMGAAYRHKMMSVMPHMAGAMIVALLTLILSMVVIQQYPDHRPLHGIAVALISIVLVQVTLGIASFIFVLLDLDTSVGFAATTAAHLSVGTLTLAATLGFMMQVRRYVRSEQVAAKPAQTAS